MPYAGLTGFVYVMVVSNLLTCTLSTSRLLTVSRAEMNWSRWVIRPLLAAGVAGVSVGRMATSDLAALLLKGSVFIVVYCLLSALLGCFTKADWLDLTAK